MTRPAAWLVAIATALSPAVGSAQPGPAPPPTPVPADGTEVFRWLLHRAGVRPVREQDLAGLARFDDVIVVVLGGPEVDRLNQRPVDWWAQRAVTLGGAALVAADSRADLGALVPFDGRQHAPHTLRVDGRPVTCQRDDSIYLGRENCPFAVPRPAPAAGGPEWELFAGLDRVATNTPSFFDFEPAGNGSAAALARFPARSLFDGRRKADAGAHPFAVGGTGVHPGSGLPYRVLALADPSVFINQMMLPIQPDVTPPDNLEFASRVVAFLTDEGGVRRRDRCLFVQNGQVVTSFDDLRALMRPPIPRLPRPDLRKMQETIVDGGNQIADKVQDRDALNRLLLGNDPGRQERVVRTVLQGLCVAAAVWAVWFAVRRVWGTRQPLDVLAAPPGGRAAPAADDPPVPGVFDRRQRELLRRNNVYEPVRAAVRELFAATAAPPAAGPRLPRVEISAAVRRPETLRKTLAELWRIGFGPPRVVTVREWDLLGPRFDRAGKAHADGKWWFADAGKGYEV